MKSIIFSSVCFASVLLLAPVKSLGLRTLDRFSVSLEDSVVAMYEGDSITVGIAPQDKSKYAENFKDMYSRFKLVLKYDHHNPVDIQNPEMEFDPASNKLTGKFTFPVPPKKVYKVAVCIADSRGKKRHAITGHDVKGCSRAVRVATKNAEQAQIEGSDSSSSLVADRNKIFSQIPASIQSDAVYTLTFNVKSRLPIVPELLELYMKKDQLATRSVPITQQQITVINQSENSFQVKFKTPQLDGMVRNYRICIKKKGEGSFGRDKGGCSAPVPVGEMGVRKAKQPALGGSTTSEADAPPAAMSPTA